MSIPEETKLEAKARDGLVAILNQLEELILLGLAYASDYLTLTKAGYRFAGVKLKKGETTP